MSVTLHDFRCDFIARQLHLSQQTLTKWDVGVISGLVHFHQNAAINQPRFQLLQVVGGQDEDRALGECDRGLERALETKKREQPPTPKLLNGEQEAHIIATRLGSPSAGYDNWSLRLLTHHVVELSIVESVVTKRFVS